MHVHAPVERLGRPGRFLAGKGQRLEAEGTSESGRKLKETYSLDEKGGTKAS